MALTHDLREKITASAEEVMENFEYLEGLIAAGTLYTRAVLDEITSDQNNYNIGSTLVVDISADATRTITGVLARAAGSWVLLRNVGSQAISLAYESASSTAANRIITDNEENATLLPGETAYLLYTGTRWLVLIKVRISATVLPHAESHAAGGDDEIEITAAQISNFAEAVQDAVAAALVAGSGQSITYDDASNTITFVNSAPLTTEAVQDIVGAMAAAGTGISVTYDDTAGTLTFANTAPESGGGLTQENVEDIVAALLVQGTNVTLSYNDATGQLTVTAAGGGGSANGTEQVAYLDSIVTHGGNVVVDEVSGDVVYVAL